MKQSIKITMATLCLSSAQAFALNPFPGWYAGIILGGSYAPNVDLTFNAPNTPLSTACSTSVGCTPTTGSLSYSGYGNIGGQIGYRRNHFRLELEPVVNYNPYDKITVGTVKYSSPKSSSSVRLKGSTTTVGVLFNGYYDFYVAGGASNFVPYLGGGIGYAYVKNDIKFYCNNVTIPCTELNKSNNGPIAQGIVGASYYLDDFTWFGLDYRYITTNKINSLINDRVQVHTINLSFNGIFNCG